MPLKHCLARLMVAAFAVPLALPAAAEVIQTTEMGFVSRHEVVVKADSKAVWLALIEPSGWWRADHTWSGDPANLLLTPQAGGCFCETIPEVDEPERFTLQGSVEHMRVIQAYPERALRMAGALGPLQSEPVTGILTIAISKADQGTRIVWEYNVGGTMRYEVPVIAKSVDGVMAAQLAALAKLLGPAVVPAQPALSDSVPDEGGVVEATSAPLGPELKSNAIPPATKAPGGPASAPAGKPAAPGPQLAPASKPAAGPAPVPASKPAPKPPSVKDAFGDLEVRPKP